MAISTKVKQMIIGPFLLLVGLVAIGAGIAEWIAAGKLKAEGVATPATVVDHRVTSTRKGGKTYKVTVQYPAGGGQMIRKEFDVSRSYYESSPDGRTVPVRHLPSDPNVAELVGEETTGLAALGVGALIAIGGGFLTRLAFQKPAPVPQANPVPL